MKAREKGSIIHPNYNFRCEIMSNFKNQRFIYFLFYVSEFCLHAYLCTMSAKPKRVLDPLEHGCELQWGCWELDLGPLREHPVSFF